MWGWLIHVLMLSGMVAGGVWLWDEANKPGLFPLQEVEFAGLTHASEQEAKQVMGVEQGVNVLTVQPSVIRHRLLTLPWIRDVTITRILPGTLAIQVEEKRAVCMALMGERLALVDEFGMMIKEFAVGDPVIAPVVSVPKSDDQAEEIVNLLNFLARHDWLKERVAQAVGLANGRWILYTREGTRLLFPPDWEAALSMLEKMQKQYQILNRRVLQVDLRIPGQVAVRLAMVTEQKKK